MGAFGLPVRDGFWDAFRRKILGKIIDTYRPFQYN